MKDITIIIPIHKLEEKEVSLLDKAIESVAAAKREYTFGKLHTLVVTTEDCEIVKKYVESIKDKDCQILINTGDTDFCSQINFAVDSVKTDFFSILEFDDEYTPKWFKMAHDYYIGNESVSVFLPVNLFHDGDGNNWQYGNVMALSPTFITPNINDTDEIGIINYLRLEKCSLFNLTGAIFNTKDFISVGKFKPSIKVAFNYEYLLRLTKKNLKAMVVPKEGYIHAIGREGSLTSEYLLNISEEDREKWFALAHRECIYDEDRKKDISTVKPVDLK